MTGAAPHHVGRLLFIPVYGRRTRVCGELAWRYDIREERSRLRGLCRYDRTGVASPSPKARRRGGDVSAPAAALRQQPCDLRREAGEAWESGEWAGTSGRYHRLHSRKRLEKSGETARCAVRGQADFKAAEACDAQAQGQRYAGHGRRLKEGKGQSAGDTSRCATTQEDGSPESLGPAKRRLTLVEAVEEIVKGVSDRHTLGHV